jgi:hypothetical protein
MNSVFLGISYIIESHVAERARVKYGFDVVYKEKTTTEQAQRQVIDPVGSTASSLLSAKLSSTPFSSRS